MSDVWPQISAWFAAGHWWNLLQALLILLGGLVVGRMLGVVGVRLLRDRLDAHTSLILRRTLFYLVLGLAVASALHQLGFKLGVLLGAAGVVSVAVGFASQTSVSNLISGLFLMAERPFAIGDTIRIGGTTGEVLSVDLLSVKLRTADNLFVRIPNETLIKTELTNFARFPIRRVELTVNVARKEDIARVRERLMAVADDNPLCLEEPKPLFVFQGFGESGIALQLLVWCRSDRVLDLKNSLHEEIKRAFDEAGIEMPFPHVSLYAGRATEALPIRLVGAPE